MNIRRKVTALVLGSLAVSSITSFLVVTASVYPSFAKLERDEAVENNERVIEAINAELDSLTVTATDYANWDDSYLYTTVGNPTFIERNFTASSVKNLNVSVIHIEGLFGKELYNGVYDGNGSEVAEPKSAAIISAIRDIAPHDIKERRVQGIISTSHGPMLIASLPILKTSGSGPSVGRIVMGRPLSAEFVSVYKARTKVDFQITDIRRGNLNSQELKAISNGFGSDKPMIDVSNNDTIYTLSPVNDIKGKVVVVVTSTMPRHIFNLGKETLFYAICSVVISEVMILLLIALAIQAILVNPILKLNRRVAAAANHGSNINRIALNRNDEIGLLSREFDATLDALSDTRGRLLAQSYHTGVSEMASGILHNLRNQLAPLTLRVSRLCELKLPPEPTRIDVAVDQLVKGRFPPEMRDKAIDYIKLSVRHLHALLAQHQCELGFIATETGQIEKVIDELEQFSRSVGTPEAINLIGPVRGAVSIVPDFPGLKIAIVVDPGIESCPAVMAKSFLLEHVVFNLLVNAAEAVLASGKPHDTVVVYAELTEHEQRSCVDIQVKDNGVGIAPENIALLFGRGYTTKNGGKRGTGLHWCANSVAAMGGRIFAESPGPGSGATFHILLPLAETSSVALAS